jgi:succinate dehydrogenase / fumarate reductase, iron-sulfur subunit
MSGHGESKPMPITLKVWRQASRDAKGEMKSYRLEEVSPDMSFLEMLDVLNEQLVEKGDDPVAFDHDCREGICGACSLVVDGQAHGPQKETTVCQLHMRHYSPESTIHVEPWRAEAFPVIRDLVVDRGAMDRIQAAGGFISAHTGSVPEANAIPVRKEDAERAMDAAACIGCGACIASCPNSAAMLFVGAKLAHLSLLPQGQIEKRERALAMVAAMDLEGFGNCTNHYECEATCPKNISVEVIARMNRQFLGAVLQERPAP